MVAHGTSRAGCSRSEHHHHPQMKSRCDAHLASLNALHETRELRHLRHLRVRHPAAADDGDDDDGGLVICVLVSASSAREQLLSEPLADLEGNFIQLKDDLEMRDSAHSAALWAWPRGTDSSLCRSVE